MPLDWTPCAQFSNGWQDATVPDNEIARYLQSVGFDPTPKQYDFITCPADDVGFGGARGGAKSHAILGDWMLCDFQYGVAAIGLVIRRELIQLNEFIERAKRVFDRANAMIVSADGKGPKWQWHAQAKTFEGPNGSRLRFAYLDVDADADKYMGHEYIRVYIEERGNFPRAQPLNRLRATLRSSAGIRCQMKSTFNPGGVGHQHCKADYRLIEKVPRGYEIFESPEGLTRVFIPSKLRDNKHLGEDYMRQLRAACAGNEALLNAWLDGDWSLLEGAFFHEWSNQHVIPAFDLDAQWLRFRSVRWGSGLPFSVGWWAVVGDECELRSMDGRYAIAPRIVSPENIAVVGEHPPITLRRGSLVRYREWYGQKSVGSNEGVKLTAEQIAAGIRGMELPGERISYTVANPEIFKSEGGPSIAERMMRAKVILRPADDAGAKRLGPASGWDALRARLVGSDGTPAIFCFSNCTESVRTLPAVQHDRDDPEQIDDESEAHAAHEWRYAAMSRPWIPLKEKPPIPGGVGLYGTPDGRITSVLTIREMIDRKTRKRKAAED